MSFAASLVKQLALEPRPSSFVQRIDAERNQGGDHTQRSRMVLSAGLAR